jgi:hypothetical protein
MRATVSGSLLGAARGTTRCVARSNERSVPLAAVSSSAVHSKAQSGWVSHQASSVLLDFEDLELALPTHLMTVAMSNES